MLLRHVHLHGRLATLYGPVHRMAVNTPAEAFRALCSQHPTFRDEFLRHGAYRITRGDRVSGLPIREDTLHLNMGRQTALHIEPVTVLGGPMAFIWIAVAVVAVAVVAVSLMPTIKAPDPNDREDDLKSFIFDGGYNAEEQGHPVPLVYGWPGRVGSVVAMGSIETTDIPYEGGISETDDSTPGWLGHTLGNEHLSDIFGGNLPSLFDKGGKGGGGEARAAQEDPNTLQSQATARVVDIISEGEIGGLRNGLRSVYFDDTPVQNADGSYNFKGVAIEERVGLPDQPYLSGFPNQENTRNVDREVTQAIGPVVETITDPDVDRARVTLALSAGLSLQDSSNGDLKMTSVSAKIELQSNGGGYTEICTHEFTGKTTSKYQRSFTFDLVGDAPWDIRVSRVTQDNLEATVTDDISFDLLTEIVDVKVTYADSAAIGIIVDAKQFGSKIPRRTYDPAGIICEVPTNYDPEARTYDGVWDGTFKRAVTNCPPWILRDIITHNRYGLGRRISSDRLDKWELYTIAQYCDGLVSDGKGGLEPRFSLDVEIKEQKEAFELLSGMCAAFRAMLYWGAGAIKVVQDSPADPSMLVSIANTLEDDGEPSYEDTDLNDMVSAILITWTDPDDGSRQCIDVVEDSEIRRVIGWKTKSVVALGCKSRAQAIRLGRWMLDDQKLEYVGYKTALDHAMSSPGEIVRLSDKRLQGQRMSGRITGSTSTTISLDHPVTLDIARSYIAYVILTDGTVHVSDVVAGSGSVSTLSLATALPSTPIVGAMWSLQSDAIVQRQWRLRSLREINELEYDVRASLHDPDKYDRIESGIVLESQPFFSVPTGGLPYPASISVQEFLRVTGTSAVPCAVVSCPIIDDVRVTFLQWQVKRPGEGWEPVGERSTTTIEVTEITEGEHTFRVRCLDALGRKGAWKQQTFTLEGMPDPPALVTEFDAYPGEDEVRFVLVPITTGVPVDYEIRQGDTWDSGAYVCRIQGDTITCKLPVALELENTFWLKTVIRNTTIYSEDAFMAVPYQAPIITRNVVLTTDLQADGWLGAKHHLTVDNVDGDDVLVMDYVSGLRAPVGHYYAEIDLGDIYYARNFMSTSAIRFVGGGLVWDDVDVNWDDMGTTPWSEGELPTDDISVVVRIAVEQDDAGLIEGFTLNGTTTGVNGTVVDTATLITYDECKSHDGAEMTAVSVLKWDTLSIPEEFTFHVDWRSPGQPVDTGVIAVITDGTLYLQIMYNAEDDTLELVDDDANTLSVAAPPLPADEVLSVAIVQTATTREFKWVTMTDPDGDETSGAYTPRGAFDTLILGNLGSGPSEDWTDATYTWAGPEATRTWEELIDLDYPMAGVFADACFWSTTSLTLTQLALRGPAGYTPFRVLIPGDYSYQRAILWHKITAPTSADDQVALATSTHYADVPDITENGSAVISSGGTRINFTRSFHVAPSVTAVQISGATNAVVRLSVDATGFDVNLYSAVDGVTAIGGTIGWQAHGY